MRWRAPRNWLIAAALLLVALGLRVAEVQGTAYRPVNDAGSYLKLAASVAHTGDYTDSHSPGTAAGGTRGPSAYFPPGFPYFLAGVDLLDGHPVPRDGAIEPARLSQAALGTVTVALVGLVAWEALGPLVGLIALGLAAIYPVLIELSGTLVAENLMTALILAAVYAVLRARRSSRPYGWIAAAGALTGLATLAHVNSVVLLAPLLAGALSVRRTFSSPVVLVVCWALVLVPWTIRNSDQLHRFVPVTDETGITLVGTYNRASAANPRVPYKWRIYYRIPGERRLIRRTGQMTEPELSSRLESQALHYIGAHPLSPLAVLWHNSLRLLELEGSFAWQASASAIDLPDSTARIGVFSFWALCLLALVGLITLPVRRAPIWLWAVPVLLWISAALFNAETPRFREPVDPFLVLSAACAAAGGVRLLGRAPVARQHRAPVAAGGGQGVEMRQRLA